MSRQINQCSRQGQNNIKMQTPRTLGTDKRREETGWTTEQSWFESRHREQTFLYNETSKPALGLPQPPLQWTPSAGVKRPGHELQHSPLSRGEVRNECRYASPSPYAFMPCAVTQFHLLHATQQWKRLGTHTDYCNNVIMMKVVPGKNMPSQHRFEELLTAGIFRF